MKASDVYERLDAIRREAGPDCADDEAAHVLEKDLWRDVLRAIADGTTDEPTELARLALTSRSIAFSRWFA